MAANASFRDFNGDQLAADLALKCQAALTARYQRSGGWESAPELIVDPLTPLPLADAAGGVVRLVYFIMASRPYGEETINRNVIALQKPGALEAIGANDSNLFLVHVDEKLGEARKHDLQHRLIKPRPDLYMLRRTRPVLWAGWSMILALFDAMASVLQRSLTFEYFINLSDADLALRTDTEIRAFLARFPGRSIMSIVQRKKDPRRYKMHEGFRSYCWTECAGGAAFAVAGGPAHAAGHMPTAQEVIGKKKCCWSRTAPIVYTDAPMRCSNAALPETFHGSQWASLHRSLVHHMVQHPFSRRVLAAMEHTLLPDEATLQTIAVNSPFRASLIPVHLRFIEWPQSHGDANKYWASVGPQFHGGPMVLNATLAREQAFKSSAMFARKVDPGLYRDVLDEWDRWMDYKMLTGRLAEEQVEIAHNFLQADPQLVKAIPPPTRYETGFNDEPLQVAAPAGPSGAARTAAAGALRPGILARLLRPATGAKATVSAADTAAAAEHAHEMSDDGVHEQGQPHGHDETAELYKDETAAGGGGAHTGHAHASLTSSVLGGLLLLWIAGLLLVGTGFLLRELLPAHACAALPRRLFRSRKHTLHSAKLV